MRAEHSRRPARHFGQALDEAGAAGLQVRNHMAIVHDLMADIDRRAIFLERALDNIYGPHYTGAKPSRLGQDDLHSPPQDIDRPGRDDEDKSLLFSNRALLRMSPARSPLPKLLLFAKTQNSSVKAALRE
jgi:hypothetical protein